MAVNSLHKNYTNKKEDILKYFTLRDVRLFACSK